MAVIYLKHSRHGTKVAVSEVEAVADEANGWERYSLAAILQPSIELPNQVVTGIDIDSSDLGELRTQWAAKFGKPPHHRKSISTLRAEVEGV